MSTPPKTTKTIQNDIEIVSQWKSNCEKEKTNIDDPPQRDTNADKASAAFTR